MREWAELTFPVRTGVIGSAANSAATAAPLDVFPTEWKREHRF